MEGELPLKGLPAHWEMTTLGEIVRRGGGSIQTGPFGSQLHAADYVEAGIPSVMPTNIGENRILENGIARITEEDAIRLRQHRLQAGDIVYSRRGDVERRSLVREREEGWLCGTGCLKVRLGKGIVDPLFASLFLGTPSIRAWIVSNAVGATMPNLNTSIMGQVPFALPPAKEQKSIAALLGALDDKIELNHRINAELEGMAKLLYDYWFVQFEFPLSAAQAKALGNPRLTGKPYKSSGGKMTHAPELKREIPDGWKAAMISDLVPIGKETTNPANDPGKTFKLFSIPVFDQRGTYSFEEGSGIGSNKFLVTGMDLLVSKLNPWTSRVIYPSEESDMICSTEFVVLRAGAPWMKNFLYMVATNPQFITFCSQSATGTSNSHKRVNPGVLTSYSFAYDAEVVRHFGETIHPMLIQRQINQQQNHELTTLRDWLLPLLMNGQVTVR